MKETLGDEPIQNDFVSFMNTLAQTLDEILNGEERPKRNGFILMIFPFEGREGRCNYISNAKRAEVITLLKQQITRFEGMPEVEGHG